MWRKIKSLLFYNTTLRQTVAKNTFWLTISNIGGRLLRAVIIIYAARILGAAEWGVFSYAISLITVLTVFTDVGISPFLVRESAKSSDNPKQQQKIISTSFIAKIAFVLVGFLFIMLFGRFFASIDGVRAILPIAVFVFAFDSIREFGFSIIRASEKMEWEAMLYLTTNVGIVAFGFLFLGLSKTAGAFTYGYALGTGIGVIATLYTIREKLRGLFSNFSFSVLKFLFASGWPLTISAVLGMLMLNTDILLIGWLQSVHDVGLYSAAQRIVQLLYILPAIITVSLLPSLSKLANTDNERLRRMLELVLAFTMSAAIPIAIGGIILGKEIIQFIFGAAYLDGTSSFQVLLATILIDFPSGILTSVAFAYDKQKSLIAYSAIGGISNVVFDLILIPRFGIVGSAWATFLAQILTIAYLWRLINMVNKPKVLPYLSKSIIAAMTMAGVILICGALGVHVIATIALGILAYVGMLVALRETLLKEIKQITSPPAA